MKKIGVIGATGYTGSELVRILLEHSEVEVSVLTSESHQGESFSNVNRAFDGLANHTLKSAEVVNDHDLDLVFLALPHGMSMKFVKRNWDARFRMIDLSGDFRLSSVAAYERWYGINHEFAVGIDSAVYGLPEINRSVIRDARLVANPGCYPTTAILGIAPLLHGGVVETTNLVIDSKSGTTGAGGQPKPGSHFCRVNDNFAAYSLTNHRHTIEIEENLSRAAGEDVLIQFTPHLLPVDRGILSTIYATPKERVREEEIVDRYTDVYDREPFVRVRTVPPSLKDVRGSNICDIHVRVDDRTGRIIVIAVIDNLVKGAAGQAIQNMNLMFGFEEKCGLSMLPLTP